MPKKSSASRTKMRSGLTETRIWIQDFAAHLGWALSRNNYIPYELFQERKRKERQREKRELLYYLKRQKLIEMRRIGKRLEVRLTEKGWTQALRDKIKTTQTVCKNGQCFVLFDIPEKERFMREILRNFLKECGFKRLQHSVWMTNRDVIEPLRALLQRRKLERWIRIIQGQIIPASPLDRLVVRQNYPA